MCILVVEEGASNEAAASWLHSGNPAFQSRFCVHGQFSTSVILWRTLILLLRSQLAGLNTRAIRVCGSSKFYTFWGRPNEILKGDRVAQVAHHYGHKRNR